MTADPRACRERFPFPHLSLAEVAEVEVWLAAHPHGILRGGNGRLARLYELWARRVNPQPAPQPKESA